MKLTKEQLLGIVRHTLTFIGGIVIARGLVDETLVTECIGGVLTLTGAIWSIINKTNKIMNSCSCPSTCTCNSKDGNYMFFGNLKNY